MGIFDLNQGRVNLHYDFEFIDTPDTLETISFGAVIETADATKKFYGINSDFVKSEAFVDLVRGDENSEWMRDNVFKHIQARLNGSNDVASIKDMWDDLKKARFGEEKSSASLTIKAVDQTRIPGMYCVVGTQGAIAKHLKFQIDTALDGTALDKVVPWAYYNAHDHVCLCRLFGGMLGMPDTWQKFSFDYRALTDAFELDHDKLDPEGPHHPLLDSIEQYSIYNKMKEMIKRG